MPIHHIAAASDWERARQQGAYDRSTRGASIEEVGFLHGSAGRRQVDLVLGAVYADASDPLVLLTLDEGALAEAGLRLVLEPGDPRHPDGEWFPHVYGGPIPVGAVAAVEPLDRSRPIVAARPSGAAERADEGPQQGAGDADHLARAIDLATANASTDGGPFGALVVTADGQEFEGTNRVTAASDPTAHAEITAIRTACSALGAFDLTGAVLYTSCEPCPMCLGSALWARVSRVAYAADRHDAASAGFDDAEFYGYFESIEHRDLMPVVHHDTGRAAEPFDAWQANESRTEY